jgi:hypothetical protein
MVSTEHNGTEENRVVAHTGLGQWQNGRSATQGVDLSFLVKYQRNPSTRRSQKTRWKGWLLLLNMDAATRFQNQTIAKKRKERTKTKKEREGPRVSLKSKGGKTGQRVDPFTTCLANELAPPNPNTIQ